MVFAKWSCWGGIAGSSPAMIGFEVLRPAQELSRVDGLIALADFEMELRRPHISRLTRLGNHLTALDRIPALHQQLTRMGICGDVAVGVPDQDQIAVTLQLISGIGDGA